MRYSNKYAGALSKKDNIVPGTFRRPDITEKHREGGSVDKFYENEEKLQALVDSAYKKFEEVFEEEKETLLSYIEEAKNKKASLYKRAAVTPDEEISTLIECVSLNDFESLSDTKEIKDLKAIMLQVSGGSDELKEKINAYVEDFPEEDDRESSRALRMRKEIEVLYFEAKNKYLEEIKNIGKDTENLDREVERDQAKSTIDQAEIPLEAKTILKQKLDQELNKEKKLEQVEQEVIKKEVQKALENELSDDSDSSLQNLDGWLFLKYDKTAILLALLNLTDIKAVNKHYSQQVLEELKSETIKGVPFLDALSYSPDLLDLDMESASIDPSEVQTRRELFDIAYKVFKEKVKNRIEETIKNITFEQKQKVVTKAGIPAKSTFPNLVKKWTQKNFKSPDTQENISFYQLLPLTLDNVGNEPEVVNKAKAIISEETDMSTANKWNWYQKEYYRIVFKRFTSESSLTKEEQVVYDLVGGEELSSLLEDARRTKKEVKDKLKDKIDVYKELVRQGYKISEASFTKKDDTGAVIVNLDEDRDLAKQKKSEGKELNKLDQYILDQIERDLLNSTKDKLRANIDFLNRIKQKLISGNYSYLSDPEQEAILETIKSNTKLSDEEKLHLCNKITSKESITPPEFEAIVSGGDIQYTRQPLSQEEKEVLIKHQGEIDEVIVIRSLKKNPEAQIGQYTKEISQAKRKRGIGLTDLEKALLEAEEIVKKKQKENAPITTLAAFIAKCKTNTKLMEVLNTDVLCEDKKLKTYDATLNKILHETYSMLVNESVTEVDPDAKDPRTIVEKNKDRIKFLVKDSIKNCILRDYRENLHKELTVIKDSKGGDVKVETDKGVTLLDYLPNNLIVDVDDTGLITKLFSMYDNKLSDLEDKIEIQEDLVGKFQKVKKIIYEDLAEQVNGDPTVESDAYLAVKRKTLGLIAAIALETGLRPSPVKKQTDEAGGSSLKNKILLDSTGKPVLTNEGKKQYFKEEVETYGVASLKKEHITFLKTQLAVHLKFSGKRGIVNVSKITDQQIKEQLEILVAGTGSTTPTVSKSLFLLPDGKKITQTDIVVYFERLAYRAGLKKLRITDFRKLKAVNVIHENLKSQKDKLYRDIAALRTYETDIAKVEIAKLVLKTVDRAYKEAQKSLSHSKVNETINSYVNPSLLLNFLSSGSVEDTIEKALGNKTTLKFDPNVFMAQALAYNNISLDKSMKYDLPANPLAQNESFLKRIKDSLADKIVDLALKLGKVFNKDDDNNMTIE